jgi:hypothetical protein
LLEHLTENLLELQRGFVYNNDKWHLVCIGVKGDFPFQIKTGGLNRHWLRAARKKMPVLELVFVGYVWVVMTQVGHGKTSM